MALSEAGLAAELLVTRSNLNNVPILAGKDMGVAIGNFWNTGLGPGGAAVIGTPAGLAMAPVLGAAYSAFAEAVITAKKVATAIDSAMLGVVLVGGVYGGHIAISTPGPSSLASGLQKIWESLPPSPAIAAKKEAKEIKNYTTQCIANGTGIPPAVPPQTGPLV